jgi:hypothetical protein
MIYSFLECIHFSFFPYRLEHGDFVTMSPPSKLRSILSWLWSLWNTGLRVFLIGVGHTHYGYRDAQLRQPISDMIREGWIRTIVPSDMAAAARGYSWWFFVSGFNMCILGLVLFQSIRTADGHVRPAPISFALLSIPLSILGFLAQPEGGWWLVTMEATYVLYANYKYYKRSSKTPATISPKKIN